jgi:hypothetical protein
VSVAPGGGNPPPMDVRAAIPVVVLPPKPGFDGPDDPD